MPRRAARAKRSQHVPTTLRSQGLTQVAGGRLPESGYQPDDGLCYEKYFDTDPEAEMDGSMGHTFTVDICIPVKPL